MKENIIKFIEDFEEKINQNVNNFERDIEYFNYLLGQKDICMSIKKKIRETNEEDLFEVLTDTYKQLNKEKENKTLDNVQSSFENGKINMVSYIIREVKKEIE